MIISLRHTLSLTLIAAVLSASAIYGYLELKTLTLKEIFSPVEAETTYGPVKLTMTLDKTVHRVGEPINITVKLENIGNRTIWLRATSPPALGFVVYNVSLQPIYIVIGVLGEFVSYRIDSYESFCTTDSWTQLGRYGSGPQSFYRQVDPGTYFIAGRTTPPTKIYDGIEEIAEVETPKIRIEIQS